MTDLEILQTHREIYMSGFNNLKGIIEILTRDFHKALKMQPGEQIQDSAGRTAFRTLFSLIEAIIYSLKRIALDLAKQGVGDFTVAEITMLEEQLYDLDDKGLIRSTTRFIPLFRNLKFAFTSACRVMFIEVNPNFGDARWDSFQKAFAIRNRITHPKSVEDLHLTDDDFTLVTEAAEWFTVLLNELIEKFGDKLTEAKKL